MIVFSYLDLSTLRDVEAGIMGDHYFVSEQFYSRDLGR